jgi:hypothetical protein
MVRATGRFGGRACPTLASFLAVHGGGSPISLLEANGEGGPEV